MYRVALATGRTVRITNASSPSLSPDHTQLAYVTVEAQSGIDYRTALAIRDLRTGRVRIVGLPPGVPMGTPPELVINWSPDGRSIALFDGSEVRTVDVRTARTVDSQPAIPGSTGLAPVYLDRQTLVVLANCCIGPQNLIAVDLLSGTRTPFARLASPVENVRRLKPGTLLVVTALHRLVRVTPGRTHSIAKRIVAATS